MSSVWKKWLLLFAGGFVAFGVLFIVVINVVIDPYGEFNLVVARFNRTKFYQVYETAPYKFARLLEKGPRVLIFGTSHSSTIDDDLVGHPVLNLSVSLYGNPQDVLKFLTSLSEKQIKNVRGVYYAIDNHTLVDGPLEQPTRDSQSYFTFLWETVRTLNPLKFRRALYTVFTNLRGSHPSYIRENGVFVHTQDANFDPRSATTIALLQQKTHYTSEPRTLQALRRLNEHLRAHDIPVVYFNTAFSSLFMRNVDLSSLKSHLQAVSEAVGEFVALNYLPPYSSNLSLFRDPTHHNLTLTRIEMDYLNDRQSSRFYRLNSGDVERYMNWLQKELTSP